MQPISLVRLWLAALFLTFGVVPRAHCEDRPVVLLDQGWDDDQRTKFYTTSISAEMLPLRWLLALEQADSSERFYAPDGFRRYGYLTATHAAAANVASLPIGLAREDRPGTLAVSRPFLSAGMTRADYRRLVALITDGNQLSRASDGLLKLPDFASPDRRELLDDPEFQRDYRQLGPFVGPNCAACHTSELTYRGTRIRIDGGTALVDRLRFSVDMCDALAATGADEAKYARFADRVLGDAPGALSSAALRRQLEVYTAAMLGLVARNYPAVATGPGRMDAFGLLFNEIDGMTMQVPDNYRVSNAPVGYPPLWNVPSYDWFQNNSCVNNPMIRNVVEVLGAFGRQAVSGPPDQLEFQASVRLKPLHDMWQQLEALRPPVWPQAILGEIDADKAARGQTIYRREKCSTCHAEQPPYPQLDANRFGRRFTRLIRVPYRDVGTDPLMAENFAQRTALTGSMQKLLAGRPMVSAFELFGAIGSGVMSAKFEEERVTPELQDKYFDQRDTQTPDRAQLLTYKAGPLAGIWATGPYLHNGSVPNLYELLQPPAARSKSFYVGSAEFDPLRVGLQSGKSPNAFRLETTSPGNSNAGHAYGTGITSNERWELVEYLKTL